MTEDMIRKVIEIDENAKRIIKDSEEKNNNIHKYISQELAIKESVIEVNNKDKIERIQQEYDEKYKKLKREIEAETSHDVQKMKEKFRQQKETLINNLFTEVIKEVEG